MPSQSDLYYSFQPLVYQPALEVVSFTLKESISQNFKLELELISYEHSTSGSYSTSRHCSPSAVRTTPCGMSMA